MVLSSYAISDPQAPSPYVYTCSRDRLIVALYLTHAKILLSSMQGIITDKDELAAQEDAITRFTTPHFRAPEMVDLYSGLPLDVRVDVWALGCMLYGLAYHKHPFQETGPLAILAARYKIPYNPSYPAPLYTLLNQTLQIKPQDRPSAQQIVDYLEAVLKVCTMLCQLSSLCTVITPLFITPLSPMQPICSVLQRVPGQLSSSAAVAACPQCPCQRL